MTQEQNELLFELIRYKLEAELAAAEVDAKLRRELMVTESEARVTAAVAAASPSAAAALAATASTSTGTMSRMSTADEDDITGEVLSEVPSITFRFAGLQYEEIVRIFQNKLKLNNLYFVRQMRRLRFNALQDHDRIGIEDRMLRLRKTLKTYKDFGESFYDVWADAFHRYTTIFVSMFSKKAPDLHTASPGVYSNVYELSIVYEWQEAVLAMTIEAHTYIVSQQPTNSTPVKSSRSNNLLISCNLFNKSGCDWPLCNRAHNCKKCGSRNPRL